jgi:hypothetical protein
VHILIPAYRYPGLYIQVLYIPRLAEKTWKKCQTIVACLLKARIVKPAEEALARELLCKHAHCQAKVATEELLETVFSARSMPRLYITRTSCH